MLHYPLWGFILLFKKPRLTLLVIGLIWFIYWVLTGLSTEEYIAIGIFIIFVIFIASLVSYIENKNRTSLIILISILLISTVLYINYSIHNVSGKSVINKWIDRQEMFGYSFGDTIETQSILIANKTVKIEGNKYQARVNSTQKRNGVFIVDQFVLTSKDVSPVFPYTYIKKIIEGHSDYYHEKSQWISNNSLISLNYYFMGESIIVFDKRKK